MITNKLRRGKIFKTNKGEYALAIYSEQYKAVKELGKVLVHLFKDKFCTEPIGEKPVLKQLDKLKLIGFSD